MTDLDDAVDFALAAYREAGDWTLHELSHRHLDDVDALAGALRRLPGEGGAVALVAVDEDFFLIVRVDGPRTRVLLSDVTAADDWDLAESALDLLDVAEPDASDEDDDPEPAGDLDLLADLGMSAADMVALLDDVDLYPDEMLSDVARALGFGEQFDDAVGLTSA